MRTARPRRAVMKAAPKEKLGFCREWRIWAVVDARLDNEATKPICSPIALDIEHNLVEFIDENGGGPRECTSERGNRRKARIFR